MFRSTGSYEPDRGTDYMIHGGLISFDPQALTSLTQRVGGIFQYNICFDPQALTSLTW